MQARLNLRYPPHFYTLWFRPEGRGTFLCSAKEKYPKEKRPDGLPANAGTLCFSQKPAFAQLAISLMLDYAQTGGSLPPVFTAMLGYANGVWVKPPQSRCTHRVPQPIRIKVRALFEASFMGSACRPHKTPSCARPGLARNAGHRHQPVSAPGVFLFGYFLLDKQEKVPRPSGRNPDSNQRTTNNVRIHIDLIRLNSHSFRLLE